MQEIKHILFVPHSPEQPINAVILAKKLSKAATALGISNHVATSVEHLDLSNVIDTVVFVFLALLRKISCILLLCLFNIVTSMSKVFKINSILNH